LIAERISIACGKFEKFSHNANASDKVSHDDLTESD
jgi:hypothetical protein